MLHLLQGFEEWQLADAGRLYIPLYLRKEEDGVCYVPYIDDSSGEKRFIKYAWLAGQWVYVDHS